MMASVEYVGDPWQGHRENEAGGKYALGIITRQYKTNSQIPVTVEITASHKGWFEFRLCKNDNVKRAATQACLDEHLLKVVSGYRNQVPSDFRLSNGLRPGGAVTRRTEMQAVCFSVEIQRR